MIRKQDVVSRLKSLKMSHVLTMVVFSIVFLGAIFGIIQYQTSRREVKSPNIEILYPVEGSAFDSESTVLEGIAENTETVLVNGEEVETNKDGRFVKEVALSVGDNVIEVVAQNNDEEAVGSVSVSGVEPIVYKEADVVDPRKVEGKTKSLSSSGPDTLWIPEITALSLAGAGWYGSRKKLKISQNK